MPYKLVLLDDLSAIEWSQAGWRTYGDSLDACNQELVRDVLLRHLPTQGLIVDAGCGLARWPIYLRRAGYRCLGIEISDEACRLIRRIDASTPLLRADARSAPLKTASVDAVLSLGVVEHEEDGPLASLHELRRVLKPGGVLVLAVPFNNLWRRLLLNHLQTFVTARRRRAGWSLGFAEYRFTTREMHGLLRQAGFEPQHMYPNDLRPPRVMGLWVDYENLTFDPFAPTRDTEAFRFRGLAARVARLLLDRVPWLVCGEVVFVARASPG
jgi:SAM-dependent methyltransferase